MIIGIVVYRSRQKEHARLPHKVITKLFDVARFIPRKGHRTRLRTDPGKECLVTAEEFFHNGQVILDDTQIAVYQLLTVSHAYFGEKLTRGGITDGGVVFEGCHLFEYLLILGGNPPNTQTGQAVCFGCHT